MTVQGAIRISNQVMPRSAAQPQSLALRLMPHRWLKARLRAFWRRRSVRQRVVHSGLILLNVILVGIVVMIVVVNPSRAGQTQLASANSTAAALQPVDQLASVNIATTVARMTNIIETPAVINQYNSEQIQLAVASTNNEVVNKPQALATPFVSRHDIHTYVTHAGDTISALANEFGVSTNSILWSNGLTGNFLPAGERLSIPPINGIVYTVRSGDTPKSLATKFDSNEAKIIAYNDAENGLWAGEQILIPDGQIVMSYAYSYSSGFAWGGSAIYGYNGYDWGNCTWYVATQITVPANWGNAATWAAGARAAGWHVSSVPTVGAIAQTPYMAGGLGHVAIVDAVSADGTKVLIRDMNGIAGFDRVGVAWEDTSTYPNYITR